MSEDTPHPSDADVLLLSRRKLRAGVRRVGASFQAAGRATAPYGTLFRIAWRQVTRDRAARVAVAFLGAMALVASLADFAASDMPIACRCRGTLYILPNVIHPRGLAPSDALRLDGAPAPGEWRFGPLVPHGPDETHAAVLLAPTTNGHPFGTDAQGRDVFARVIHGTRTALLLGVSGATVLVILGTALGAVSGFSGGAIDAVISRLIESLAAIPTLLLVLVVGSLTSQPTAFAVLWTMALTRWTELARLVRAEVLLTLGEDYVTAARALGAPPSRVLLRHILPNALGPATVAGAFGIASIVLVEAAVDFLKVTPPGGAASWGETLGEARAHVHAWWLFVFPGAALLMSLVALNVVAEAAREALDPRMRGPGHSPV